MNQEIYLKCKDHSVSGEEFELVFNKDLEMLSTYPVPKLTDLGSYYESDEYISHTDSKKSFFDIIYQLVKNFAIGKKVKLISSSFPKKTNNLNVLDIGCGTGDFLLACKKNKYNISGVEPNDKARSISEAKLETSIYSDLSELIEKKFDCITMWHVLEHVPNLSEYIKNLKLLLKDKGVLIVAVPNFKSFDAKHYSQFWAAYDVPRHLSHFSNKSISKLFAVENMKVVKTIPMKFDSYYVSLLSEKYKSGFSNPIKGFYFGLLSNIKAKRTGEYSSLIYLIKSD